MAKGISEIVGAAFSIGRSRMTVYRALKILICAKCGELISEGALFTRRSLYGQGLCILPQCQKCAPFTLRAAGKEGRQSALLESLLAPQPEGRGNEPRKRDAGAEREVVGRRLGPALRYRRQS
jgi:hypothetical protein